MCLPAMGGQCRIHILDFRVVFFRKEMVQRIDEEFPHCRDVRAFESVQQFGILSHLRSEVSDNLLTVKGWHRRCCRWCGGGGMHCRNRISRLKAQRQASKRQANCISEPGGWAMGSGMASWKALEQTERPLGKVDGNRTICQRAE